MLTVTALVACDWPTTVCGCTPPKVVYTVNGTVMLASSVPLSGATVAASRATTTCDKVVPSYTFVPYPMTTSHGDGRFVLSISDFGPTCVRLVARHPASMDSVRTDLGFGEAGSSQTLTIRFP